jgi:hypothetical protein
MKRLQMAAAKEMWIALSDVVGQLMIKDLPYVPGETM